VITLPKVMITVSRKAAPMPPAAPPVVQAVEKFSQCGLPIGGAKGVCCTPSLLCSDITTSM
jgi:hypothetical protein